MPVLTVAQLAEICRGEVEGSSELLISGASTLEHARESDLAFAANRKAEEAAKSSRAGCLLVPTSFAAKGTWSLIRLQDPRVAFAHAIAALYPRAKRAPAIHPTAMVAATAKVPSSCYIGAYAVIGEHTTVGADCSIGTGCVIGDHVSIGDGSVLHPNVTIYDNVRIGVRVILHAGCVVGADGFGFTLVDGHYEKFPQIGTVEIGDDVELGANSCVDRAALGVTRIGTGTKLDNLVHVAHNCDIGKHVAAAAQTGFSGSVIVGDYAVIGGQVGIADKANIEAKAVLGAQAGIVTGQTVHAGEPVWGTPARPLRQHLKGLAHVAKLPQYREELRELKQRIAALEKQCAETCDSDASG